MTEARSTRGIMPTDIVLTSAMGGRVSASRAMRRINIFLTFLQKVVGRLGIVLYMRCRIVMHMGSCV